MSQIIDRRSQGRNKSAVNRQRFIRRFRNALKKSVDEIVSKRKITDMDKGEEIIIPSKDIKEPHFGLGQAGRREMVHPGNKEFSEGDRIKRPPTSSGQGKGEQASNQGEGLDDFAFQLSREEFLELMFDDLALPDLVKKQITKIEEFKTTKAGFTSVGTPTNISIVRSMRAATGRRIAFGRKHRRRLKEIESEIAALEAQGKKDSHYMELMEEQAELQRKLNAIPFIDDFDLRYHNRIKQPSPSTQAVMFCLMDVSGSMDEAKKDIAKRFFILLYLFLTRNYKKIDLVFIRHHTSAKEVDEEEFFYSRETGGTVVSSALEKMRDIINERYPSSAWNIYAAQASDGDNWNADSPYCGEILTKDIMKKIQYFAYVEIMPRHHQSLWEAYQIVEEKFPNFSMQHIDNLSDIYPVFRELFKKESA